MDNETQQKKLLTEIILAASWPDGSADGFPTRRVAELIALRLYAEGVRAL